MPTLFIGHGSPMNTISRNGFTNEWRRYGAALARPRGILVVSAHWYVGVTAVTAMSKPRTIHDFYGFPRELQEFQYPAPGLPELAQEVAEVAKPDWIGLDHDQWGIDHGSWSVLAHMFPEADVPVVQLSINATKPMDYHFGLGARLDALRRDGILVLASGNVVHNLRLMDRSAGDVGEAWAQRFDDAAVDVMANRPADILSMTDHPDFKLAVPTDEHFVPLVYTAAIAASSGEVASPLLRGYSMGSASMTCYGVSCGEVECSKGHDAAFLPRNVPPDHTNA